MYKWLLVLIWGIISFKVNAIIVYDGKINFDPTINGLCFNNAKFNSNHPLAMIANKYGACNGMSSITEFFYNNAIFDCTKPKSDSFDYESTIKDIVALGNNQCDKKIIIPGYCNLKKFCNDYNNYFSTESIRLNANHTLFGQDSDLNFILKTKTTNEQSTFSQNIETLYNIYNNIKEKKPTRILYYQKGFGGHVVLIYGLTIYLDKNNERTYYLHAWDPNFPDDETIINMKLDSSTYFYSHSNNIQTHNQKNYCENNLFF